MTKTVSIRNEIKNVSSTRKQGTRWANYFLVSAAALLFVTGMAKIISALGKSEVLKKPDPIFNIHYNNLLLFVGLIELVIAVVCLTTTKQRFALWLLAVLSINFLGYRVGLWAIHWQGYCPCLGNLQQAIHLSPKHANVLARIIFLYLIVGSIIFLSCTQWMYQRK